jgi:phosphate/sulfate permease
MHCLCKLLTEGSLVLRVFAVVLLQVCTACANAFAHGSNEVANAVGPLAAIYQVRHQAPQGKRSRPATVAANLALAKQ